jgi:hypothetical protein
VIDSVALNDVTIAPSTWNNPEAPLTAASDVSASALRNAALPRAFSVAPVAANDIACVLPVSPVK